jgi:transcription initiation factor TFIID subunit 8
MNDGARECGRDIENNKYAKKKPKGDNFVEAIAKIAVAQVCENAGFHGCQQSALNSLSDVVVRYIHDLGKTANFYANLSGRTEGNVFDIVHGLEDL